MGMVGISAGPARVAETVAARIEERIYN